MKPGSSPKKARSHVIVPPRKTNFGGTKDSLFEVL